MLYSMDLTVIKWLTNNQDQQETLLELVVWIGEYVFWNLLKSFCHVTEKAIGRKEIFFYHKRDFQKLANKSFHHFTSQKTLTLVDKNFRPKLLKNFQFTPVTAKCRILPKKSLESYRIICRTEKLDSENLAEANLRVFLEYAASKLFENSVDIKHRGTLILYFLIIKKYYDSLPIFFCIIESKIVHFGASFNSCSSPHFGFGRNVFLIFPFPK